jgi:hypothetical protein
MAAEALNPAADAFLCSNLLDLYCERFCIDERNIRICLECPLSYSAYVTASVPISQVSTKRGRSPDIGNMG